MLLKIIKRAGYIFKKNPCLSCIVRSCCLKKCEISDQWNRRFDLIKLPFQICYYLFMIIFILLLIMVFGLLFLILSLVGYEGLDKILQEEVRY